MRRLLKICWFMLVLAACAGDQPTAAPTNIFPEPKASPTEAQAQNLPTRAIATLQPTAVANLDVPTRTPLVLGDKLPPTPTASIEPTALPAGAETFVIPEAEPEFQISPPQLCQDMVYDEASGNPPIINYASEIQCFFEAFYQARTLERGGTFDVNYARRLVAGAYADYTIPLLNRDVEKAEKGELLEVRYSNISTKILEDQGDERFIVEVTRTRTNVTPTGSDENTATLKFRAVRTWLGGLMSGWYVDNFFNPSTNNWVSATVNLTIAQVQPEVEAFFTTFYAARSVQAGGRIDLQKTVDLTNFAYRAYTLPPLQNQAIQVENGTISAINYSDITVEVLDYDSNASQHGGLATVKVTRTQTINYANGKTDSFTVTNQFRVHRHFDDRGAGYWYAVDFFQPDAQQWVSAIAGQEVPIPQGSHG